jgi:hypothetical protein
MRNWASILFNETHPNRDRIVLSRRFPSPALRKFFPFSDKQFFVCIAALLFLSYIWFASAGTMSRFPTKTYLLEMQADAFRHGQISLLVKPAPELLRADNPYDRAYQKFWLWDAIYFHGKYYTYWGPVPALFVATVKLLTRLRSLPDQYPCLFFALVRLALSLTLIWQAWRLFGRRNLWVLAACGLVMALANPFPYLLSLADVYATAILAGQAFSLAGLSLALHAMTGGKGRKAILVAAGCCWALAFGSRLALLPALGFLAVITALAIAPQMGRVWRQGFVVAILSLAAPMLLGLVLLGWFNWIRFGDPFETGLYYQLSLLTLTKMMNTGYVAINSYLYWLKPPDFIGQFPFLFVLENPSPLIPWFVANPPMPYYLKEPIAGIPWMQPFAVYALLAVQYAWAEKARIFPTSLPSSPSAANSLALGWLITACAGYTILAMAPLLCFWMASMRYTADFSDTLLLLACIGSMFMQEKFSKATGRKVIYKVLFVVIVTITVLIGALVWVDCDHGYLGRFNPELMEKFIKIFGYRMGRP